MGWPGSYFKPWFSGRSIKISKILMKIKHNILKQNLVFVDKDKLKHIQQVSKPTQKLRLLSQKHEGHALDSKSYCFRAIHTKYFQLKQAK